MGLLVASDVDKTISSQETFLDVIENKSEVVDIVHSIDTTFSSLIFADKRKLNSALLERLTFVIDVHEEILNMNNQRSQKMKLEGFQKWNDRHLPLAERLRGETVPLNIRDLTNYIMYAKQYVKVHWNEKCRNYLKKVSMDIGNFSKLKSLAQCRARIELRDFVEESDINEVAEIIIECQSDKSAKQPIKKPRQNTKKAVISDFMSEFRRIAAYKENGIVKDKEMEEIANLVHYETSFISFEHLIETLRMNNYILESGTHLYRSGNQSLNF